MVLTNTTVWQYLRDSLDSESIRTRPEQILLSLVFIIYTFIGLTGNGLVLFSIVKIRNWSGLESAMMCFLSNLAVSDLLLCFITFPATALSAASNRWPLGEVMCWVVGFATSYLRIVSILLMMWIGVHRALVIKFPLRKKINGATARIVSTTVWLFATVPQLTCFAGVSPMRYDPERAVCIAEMISENMLAVVIYATLYLLVPMGVIIGVYSMLLFIAVNAVKHTKTLTELQNKDGDGSKKKKTLLHRRAFITVFIQIGGFLLCFLPFIFIVGLSAVGENMVPKRIQVYGACSSSISALINPVIYLNTNKTFKKFVLSFVRCSKQSNGGTSTLFSQAFRNVSVTELRSPAGRVSLVAPPPGATGRVSLVASPGQQPLKRISLATSYPASFPSPQLSAETELTVTSFSGTRLRSKSATLLPSTAVLEAEALRRNHPLASSAGMTPREKSTAQEREQ